MTVDFAYRVSSADARLPHALLGAAWTCCAHEAFDDLDNFGRTLDRRIVTGALNKLQLRVRCARCGCSARHGCIETGTGRIAQERAVVAIAAGASPSPVAPGWAYPRARPRPNCLTS